MKQEPEPEISVHALNGCMAPDTMRMLEKIKKESVILLLDTGSTITS